MQGLLALS